MLQLKDIAFTYNTTPVLKNISFDVKAGEHVSIIGASGSGKTTLLKLIYGEYDLIEGQIFWNDAEVLGPKHNLVIGTEYMKYVAQEFDLMPYITVEENIGKFLPNFYPEEKQQRTDELLDVVELKAFTKTKVKDLSGGQKQRVALARAIAKQPEIILLDEPFSHIDNFKKQSLRRNLFAHLKNKNIACIVATHDKDDVLAYADQIIVLYDTKIIANDSPEHLYNHPKNNIIASFFGEFNTFSLSEIASSNSNNQIIVYAHELKVVAKSKLKVIVKQSYFKGNHYLIETHFKTQSVFFEHPTHIGSGSEICLSVSDAIIAERTL